MPGRKDPGKRAGPSAIEMQVRRAQPQAAPYHLNYNVRFLNGGGNDGNRYSPLGGAAENVWPVAEEITRQRNAEQLTTPRVRPVFGHAIPPTTDSRYGRKSIGVAMANPTAETLSPDFVSKTWWGARAGERNVALFVPLQAVTGHEDSLRTLASNGISVFTHDKNDVVGGVGWMKRGAQLGAQRLTFRNATILSDDNVADPRQLPEGMAGRVEANREEGIDWEVGSNQSDTTRPQDKWSDLRALRANLGWRPAGLGTANTTVELVDKTLKRIDGAPAGTNRSNEGNGVNRKGQAVWAGRPMEQVAVVRNYMGPDPLQIGAQEDVIATQYALGQMTAGLSTTDNSQHQERLAEAITAWVHGVQRRHNYIQKIKRPQAKESPATDYSSRDATWGPVSANTMVHNVPRGRQMSLQEVAEDIRSRTASQEKPVKLHTNTLVVRMADQLRSIYAAQQKYNEGMGRAVNLDSNGLKAGDKGVEAEHSKRVPSAGPNERRRSRSVASQDDADQVEVASDRRATHSANMMRDRSAPGKI